MPLPSLGLLRLTPPDIKDVGVNSGTGDLSERVRRYHVNRERRVFLAEGQDIAIMLVHHPDGARRLPWQRQRQPRPE